MKPITGLVVGSLCLLTGLVSGLAWVPSSVADSVAYSAAGACKELAPNGPGCWSEIHATVIRTEILPQPLARNFWVVVIIDGFGQQRFEVAHRNVFKTLAEGDTVVARFWKGSVALVHIPGRGDLPTENEPGNQLGTASMVAVFSLLAGLVFFLGALGLHRHAGSWTLSLSRDVWRDELIDVVASPGHRWLQAMLIIVCVGLGPAALAWAFFDVPLLPAAAVGLGFASLGWAWYLHLRARRLM
jgi:hypothetical protein